MGGKRGRRRLQPKKKKKGRVCCLRKGKLKNAEEGDEHMCPQEKKRVTAGIQRKGGVPGSYLCGKRCG